MSSLEFIFDLYLPFHPIYLQFSSLQLENKLYVIRAIMFPRIFAILSLRTVYVLSFQNQKLSLTTILSKSTPTWFPPPHYSSSSNEFKSRRASTFDTDVPVRINSSDIKTRQDDVQRSIRRRRRIPIPPSQDVNFLLKRTQYLLDLTPTDLDLSSEEGKDDYDNEQNNQRQHGRIKIHRHTFHWLIDAWANSYHPKATFYAHSLLDQMKNLSPALSNDDMSSDVNERQNLIRPNVRSYTKVMNAYSKEGKDDSGDKAFELLQEMINFNDVVQDDTHEGINNYLKPNVMTYACVLEAYANSGTSESAFRAEELCMEMIQNMVADNQLEIHGGSIVESFDGDNQDSNLIQTTTRCYNAVIQAYSKSGMYDRAQRAETFIKQIESLRREQLKEGSTVIIEPNTVNYNTILTAYANSGLPDAAEQTERILKKKMKHPNVISYNSCIDAWAKSGHLDSGEKAYALLREMNELYESNQNADVKPNTRSYNSVMNAYAKSSNRDGPQRAEKILDMMEDLEKNGNKDVKPDFFSFATAINAWGRSYQFGKAQRVLNIFRHMIDLYENGNESVRPNGKCLSKTFNVVVP